MTSDSFWLLSALDSHSVLNARTGEIASPVVKQLSKEHYHLNAKFPHGQINANLYFKDDYLKKAVIDSNGHIVTFELIT